MIVGMDFSLKSDPLILLNFSNNNLYFYHINTLSLLMKSLKILPVNMLMTINLKLFKLSGFKKLNNQDNIKDQFTN